MTPEQMWVIFESPEVGEDLQPLLQGLQFLRVRWDSALSLYFAEPHGTELQVAVRYDAAQWTLTVDRWRFGPGLTAVKHLGRIMECPLWRVEPRQPEKPSEHEAVGFVQ